MDSGFRELWDAEADRFDDEPDHGLRDHAVRRAWTQVLLEVLPQSPARVVDLGCGTGSLSVLLAELGYDVRGVDFSPRMIARARAKARDHGVRARSTMGDAAAPPPDGNVDVVLGRHVTWAIPDVAAALDRWVDLLAGHGRLVLIEGFWATGAGLRATDLLPFVRSRTSSTSLLNLSPMTSLWGTAVDDERYLITGDVHTPGSA